MNASAIPDNDQGKAAGVETSVKLHAKNLVKAYGSLRALDNVSLAVREGEFVSLLGPSGSGKTTLLTMIAGLTLPDSGEIWINGQLATYLPIQHRDIGMVFQNYALFPHLSVFENIAFPLKMRNLAEAKIREDVGQALEMVHLSHAADRLPSALSGGQQQRIALARCLVYKPSIILMDEPLGALDRKLREEMQLEIRRLHRALGTTLLYVTHDQDEAMTMSDRVCLMQNGAIEQVGTPSELYFSPRTEFVAGFLGNSNFIDATVEGKEGDHIRVRLPDGAIIKAVPPAGNHGAEIRIMMRPERVRIGPASSGENQMEGTLNDTVIVGEVTRTYVNVPGDATVSATSLTARGSQPTLGSRIVLNWDVADTLAFPR